MQEAERTKVLTVGIGLVGVGVLLMGVAALLNAVIGWRGMSNLAGYQQSLSASYETHAQLRCRCGRAEIFGNESSPAEIAEQLQRAADEVGEQYSSPPAEGGELGSTFNDKR